jgi:hypothetical protein
MRHSTFVRLSVLSLSVGLVGFIPARAAAQAGETALQPVQNTASTPRALSRQVQIDFGPSATTKTGPAPLKFTLSPPPGNPRIKLEGIGDPSFGPPMDRNMPMINGDPLIDPKIVMPLQENGVHHTIRAIPVPR